jgi:hypothetical protein
VTQVTAAKISWLLWTLYVSVVLVSIPTFSLAWKYSPNRPGSVKDADFYFMIQNCVMQLFGLGVAVQSLWGRRSGSMVFWLVPTAFGSVVTILAPLLYLKMPTPWSSYCILSGSAVQAFMVLQLAYTG